jgi:hypothetical protein
MFRLGVWTDYLNALSIIRDEQNRVSVIMLYREWTSPACVILDDGCKNLVHPAPAPEWVSSTSLTYFELHSFFSSLSERTSPHTSRQNGFPRDVAPLCAPRHHAPFSHPRLSADRSIFRDRHDGTQNYYNCWRQLD